MTRNCFISLNIITCLSRTLTSGMNLSPMETSFRVELCGGSLSPTPRSHNLTTNESVLTFHSSLFRAVLGVPERDRDTCRIWRELISKNSPLATTEERLETVFSMLSVPRGCITGTPVELELESMKR